MDKSNNRTSSPWIYTRTLWRRYFGVNASEITPLLFVGGQFTAERWPLLYALGLRAVLSLQQERADTFAGPQPEQTLRLLVPDFHPPTVEQLREGVAFIAAATAQGLPVLVHCHAGVGRAPLMAAAYLVAHQQCNHRDALRIVRAARPIIGPNAAQVRRLHEWETIVRAEALAAPAQADQ